MALYNKQKTEAKGSRTTRLDGLGGKREGVKEGSRDRKRRRREPSVYIAKPKILLIGNADHELTTEAKASRGTK